MNTYEFYHLTLLAAEMGMLKKGCSRFPREQPADNLVRYANYERPMT